MILNAIGDGALWIWKSANRALAWPPTSLKELPNESWKGMRNMQAPYQGNLTQTKRQIYGALTHYYMANLTRLNYAGKQNHARRLATVYSKKLPRRWNCEY